MLGTFKQSKQCGISIENNPKCLQYLKTSAYSSAFDNLVFQEVYLPMGAICQSDDVAPPEEEIKN